MHGSLSRGGRQLLACALRKHPSQQGWSHGGTEACTEACTAQAATYAGGYATIVTARIARLKAADGWLAGLQFVVAARSKTRSLETLPQRFRLHAAGLYARHHHIFVELQGDLRNIPSQDSLPMHQSARARWPRRSCISHEIQSAMQGPPLDTTFSHSAMRRIARNHGTNLEA